jgi:hypothetical protein
VRWPRKSTLAAAFALAAPSLAVAAAVPVEPAANARDATPVFRWQVPPGEENASISIANRPLTAPDGSFLPQHVVHEDPLGPHRREWAPAVPLYAGKYWWSVGTRDVAGAALFSAPQPFTVPVALRVLLVRMVSPRSGRLQIDARWKGNVRNATVKLALLRGGRQAWWTRSRGVARAGPPYRVSKTIRVPPGLRGARVILRVTVAAGGVAVSKSRSFRVP